MFSLLSLLVLFSLCLLDKLIFELPARNADDCESKAFAYMRTGQRRRALAWLKKGLELNPSRIEMLGNLCVVYNNLEQYEDALGICEKGRQESEKAGLTQYEQGLS